MSEGDEEGRQTGWPGLRARLFHGYFLLKRPMTLGVRGLVLDEVEGKVFLIRHTYVPGWQLPGGGVELGETMARVARTRAARRGQCCVDRPAQAEIRALQPAGEPP